MSKTEGHREESGRMGLAKFPPVYYTGSYSLTYYIST